MIMTAKEKAKEYCEIHEQSFFDDVCPGCIKDDIDEQTIQDEK